MNKRPGHVKVTTEPGYCSFCDRTRNLRREEHQLGSFVRTVVTCETCHRTLSSTMGVASVEPATADTEVVETPTPASTKATPASGSLPKERVAATKAKTESPKPIATKARTTKPK